MYKCVRVSVKIITFASVLLLRIGTMFYFSDKNNLIKWVVLLGDSAVYALCMYIYVHLFPQNSPQSLVNHIGIGIFIMLMILCLFSIAIPTRIHQRLISLTNVLNRNVIVVFCSQMLFSLLWHVITRHSDNEVVYGTSMMVIALAVLLLKRMCEREALRWLRSKGRNTRLVLLVGSDPANMDIYRAIMSDPATGYRVIGYFGDDESIPYPVDHLGSVQDLLDLIKSDTEEHKIDNVDLKIDEVYCALDYDDIDAIRTIMNFCNRYVMRFCLVPRIQQSLQLRLKPEMIGRGAVYTNYQSPLIYMSNRVLKRTFDIVFSIVVLILLLPFIPIIALIIKMQSPGPVIFKQERTGINGHQFTCYKFRSMNVNSDADTVQATKDDPRKFPFGDFIRRYNIDELPQFWNVLKGDMSIVGPRPHMLKHTEQYAKVVEKYMFRHYAKPGITGYAQVTGSRGEITDLSQMEERVQKDVYYIENWSFWFDLKLIGMTALTMFIHDKKAY